MVTWPNSYGPALPITRAMVVSCNSKGAPRPGRPFVGENAAKVHYCRKMRGNTRKSTETVGRRGGAPRRAQWGGESARPPRSLFPQLPHQRAHKSAVSHQMLMNFPAVQPRNATQTSVR